MNALIIVLTVFFICGGLSSLTAKALAKLRRAQERGSRAVELEEFDRWSSLLLNEYNELTGQNIPYPAIDPDKKLWELYKLFQDPYVFVNNKWKDAEAIESLRLKHNLPSDEEIDIMHKAAFGKILREGSTYYTSLARIIEQCVIHSVHKRGYKYQGTDYEERENIWRQWEEIRQKSPWMANDPTIRDWA